MSVTELPAAIVAADVAPRGLPSAYPAPFAALMRHRQKRALGEPFGLTNFGVNLTRIAPGGISALRHAHARQDEFIYVLEGNPTLVTDTGETALFPGHCAGFRAGQGVAHQLLNRGTTDVVLLEIGDRTPGDTVHYPTEDLRAEHRDGRWYFQHKDGTPY